MSDGRMPVFTDVAAYRAATAELSLSTRLVEEPDGAIVITRRRAEAFADAAAIVLVDPEHKVDDAAGVPVLTDRPLLPEPLVGSVRRIRGERPPRAIVIEAAATRSDLEAVLRDAVGWARVLCGAVEVETAASTESFVLASALAAGVPVTITVTVLAGGAAAHLRATAVGEQTIEVVVDPFAGTERVETATAEGRSILPSRFESTARATLRRALEALAHGAQPSDLQDLRADGAAARSILGA